MQKRKIRQVSVVWNNGETDTFDCDGTFSESFNSRKKAGFSNIEEWMEYHITWIMYVRDLPPVEEESKKVDREALRGKAWCPIHNCEPTDCFRTHNPTAYSNRPSQWDDVEAIQKKQLPKIFQKNDFLDFGFEEFRDIREGYSNGNHH